MRCPNIAGAIGLAAALKFVNEVGLEQINDHSKGLLSHAMDKLTEIEGLVILG